jgi:hypothetical protein
MIKPAKQPPKAPSARHKYICLPFASEQQYDECVAAPKQYRQFLAEQFQARPELFPSGFAAGYQFHSQYRQKKQKLVLRRIKLKASAAVFTLRPSFVGRHDRQRPGKVASAFGRR